MLQLQGDLMVDLIKCVISTHPQDIEMLATDHKEILLVDYQTQTSGSLSERIASYLNQLDSKRTILKFIDFYKETLTDGQRADQLLIAFFEKLGERYTREQADWKLSKKLFESCIIQERLPFINRQKIKDTLYKVANQDNGLIVVDGECQSGLSFLGWYVSHVASSINYFQYVEIDLSDIDQEDADQVTDVDIAMCLASKIGMPDQIERRENFKYRTFAQKFGNFVRSKSVDVKFIFFFHQFRPTVTTVATDMVHNIIKMLLKEKLPCYIFISGCPQVKKWPGEIRHLIDIEELGHGAFNKQDLEDFFDDVYHYLSETYDFPETLEAFREQADGLISERVLQNPRNVVEISKIVTAWFKKFTSV